ncbi:MAG: MarR family transcriptional regulator [archaeon]|nr:MAG: MarR family transcriptional regulator [archaeon]
MKNKMKKISKFSWEKVALSHLEVSILIHLVKEGPLLNQKELLRRTKSTFGGISKAIKRLEEKGLIFVLKDSINFYGINPYRKKEIERFITGYQLGKNKPLVLSGHAFVYEAKINDLPDKLIRKLEKDKSFLGYCPRGWKYAFRFFLPDGSFKFHKTKNGCKLIAYFRTFGFDPITIEQINNEKFFSLKSELEIGYPGLKIGIPEQVAICPWQEYALQKDVIASKGIQLGIKHKKIEQSYGYPEWEEKGYNAKDKIRKIISLREKEIKLFDSAAPLNKEPEIKQDIETAKNIGNKV